MTDIVGNKDNLFLFQIKRSFSHSLFLSPYSLLSLSLSLSFSLSPLFSICISLYIPHFSLTSNEFLTCMGCISPPALRRLVGRAEGTVRVLPSSDGCFISCVDTDVSSSGWLDTFRTSTWQENRVFPIWLHN